VRSSCLHADGDVVGACVVAVCEPHLLYATDQSSHRPARAQLREQRRHVTTRHRAVLVLQARLSAPKRTQASKQCPLHAPACSLSPAEGGDQNREVSPSTFSRRLCRKPPQSGSAASPPPQRARAVSVRGRRPRGRCRRCQSPRRPPRGGSSEPSRRARACTAP
jgi:hypothetical protein